MPVQDEEPEELAKGDKLLHEFSTREGERGTPALLPEKSPDAPLHIISDNILVLLAIKTAQEASSFPIRRLYQWGTKRCEKRHVPNILEVREAFS